MHHNPACGAVTVRIVGSQWALLALPACAELALSSGASGCALPPSPTDVLT